MVNLKIPRGYGSAGHIQPPLAIGYNGTHQYC